MKNEIKFETECVKEIVKNTGGTCGCNDCILNEHIEEQKVNTDVIKEVCGDTDVTQYSEKDEVEDNKREFYTQHGWKGELYEETRHLGTVGIAKLIRKRFKNEFPGCKFSVTTESYSGGSAITVALMVADFKVIRDFKDISKEALFDFRERRYNENGIKKAQEEKYHQLNQYALRDKFDADSWCNGVFLTEEGHKVMQRVTEIVTAYRYDDSDGQVDYFDTNFYLHLAIGKWDKDFEQLDTTKELCEMYLE